MPPHTHTRGASLHEINFIVSAGRAKKESKRMMGSKNRATATRAQRASDNNDEAAPSLASG